MESLLDGLSAFDLALWGCALGGSLFFVLRVMMALVVGFAGDEMESLGADGVDGNDTDTTFKFLSLNSIAAFIMMFGWSGLTADLHFGLGVFLSLSTAIAVGAMSMAGTAFFFRFVAKLQSPGADFQMEDLVGKTGTVYARIPEEGRGSIQILAAGMTREVDAITEGVLMIPSEKSVKVVRIEGTAAVVDVA